MTLNEDYKSILSIKLLELCEKIAEGEGDKELGEIVLKYRAWVRASLKNKLKDIYRKNDLRLNFYLLAKDNYVDHSMEEFYDFCQDQKDKKILDLLLTGLDRTEIARQVGITYTVFLTRIKAIQERIKKCFLT